MRTVKLHRILAGLAVGAGLLLSGPAAIAEKGAADAAGKSGRVPKPVISITQGEKCVEPTDEIRRNHMKMIKHQRDRTMHEGIRTTQHSLKGCVNCHADAKTGSVLGKDGFCESCHRYAAVNIDCFECHTPKREEAAASGPTPSSARALGVSATLGSPGAPSTKVSNP